MKSLVCILVAVGTLGLGAGTGAYAQEIVTEALQLFPAETTDLEYVSPARIRDLPNYDSLRQRYIGQDIQAIDDSLKGLGASEKDVDDLVLGRASATAKVSAVGGLYGLAGGHFNGELIARQAAGAGIDPVPVGDTVAFCPTSRGGTCFVLFDDTRGAFGSLKQLSAMLANRAGLSVGLESNQAFTALLSESRTDTPIWGVVERSAIATWMRAFVPGQDNMQLNWSQLLSGVDTLAYSIKPGDKNHLEMTLDCRSSAVATGVREILDDLRLVEQLAWSAKNPNAANPFQNIEVSSASNRVDLQLDTAASGLSGL